MHAMNRRSFLGRGAAAAEKYARSSNVRATMIFNNECPAVNDLFREERLARLAEKAAQEPA